MLRSWIRLFVLGACLSLAGWAAPTSTLACDIEAGPLWNQQDAENKCPQVCSGNGSWTGQWHTTVEGQMSVCDCTGPVSDKEAGPIWSNDDAKEKCPNVCSNLNGTWTGQWHTTVEGQMSVCACGVCQTCKNQDTNAGPLWNNDDANNKCSAVCSAVNGTWTGQWHTTVEGQMSVCDCKICQ